MDLFNRLTSIDPSKECLKFLTKRILSNNYRGIHMSQHNRYNIDTIATLLKEMYDLIGVNTMRIRTTDLSKRPYNTPEEYIYAHYVDRIIGKTERGTQDSVRKTLFVDLHRMGLLNRYDKNNEPIHPYERKTVYNVGLSDMGVEFINSIDDVFLKNVIYTKAIDILTNGFANDLLDIVSINGRISIYEFMLFISYINCTSEYDNHTYTKEETVQYLLEFRKLSYYQKQAVIDIVEDYCTPSRFTGDKTNKRDFQNWKNETQQIFMLMGQTVFYEERNGELNIRIGDTGLFEDESKLQRSLTQKNEYFKNHKVKKEIGFELHHIIPLLSARNRVEFQMLDVWENMIYIDGYTHSKISHTHNKNTELNFIEENVILRDVAKIVDDVFCINKINVIYDVTKQSKMKNYNDSINKCYRCNA